MEFAGPTFVLAIIGMSFVAWIITTAIRARHGYPIENEWGGTIARDGGAEATRQHEQLALENAALRGRIERLEARMGVMERIATDTPARLTAEIEKLR